MLPGIFLECIFQVLLLLFKEQIEGTYFLICPSNKHTLYFIQLLMGRAALTELFASTLLTRAFFEQKSLRNTFSLYPFKTFFFRFNFYWPVLFPAVYLLEIFILKLRLNINFWGRHVPLVPPPGYATGSICHFLLKGKVCSWTEPCIFLYKIRLVKIQRKFFFFK